MAIRANKLKGKLIYKKNEKLRFGHLKTQFVEFFFKKRFLKS